MKAGQFPRLAQFSRMDAGGAMSPPFPTSLSGQANPGRGEEWDAIRAEWQGRIVKLPHAEYLKVRDYPRTGYRLENDRVLEPAGCWLSEVIGELGGLSLVVFCRLIEPARGIVPDLFEAKLSVHNAEAKSLADISDLVPSYSENLAVDRFRAALTSEEAAQMASTLGDSPLVRAFGVAVSPGCMAQALKASPAPTASELQMLSKELSDASHQLLEVLEKWQGTDALAYLSKSPSTKSALRRLEALQRLPELTWLNVAPRRPGRPLKAGPQLVVAHGLATMWRNCGLGEPKTSPQSRFIRACNIVLPWHKVHKADVAQFMRGELAKQRKRNVVIG